MLQLHISPRSARVDSRRENGYVDNTDKETNKKVKKHVTVLWWLVT